MTIRVLPKIKQTLSIGLVLLISVVANPPTYFSLLLPNLQVTLFLDIPDLDEDMFVRTCTSVCPHDTCLSYKEESRSDYGRNEKILLKLKFEYNMPARTFLLPAIPTQWKPVTRNDTRRDFVRLPERPPDVSRLS